MKTRTVERHKKGWAVVEKHIGGCLNNAKTVISIWKSKQEALDNKNAGSKP